MLAALAGGALVLLGATGAALRASVEMVSLEREPVVADIHADHGRSWRAGFDLGVGDGEVVVLIRVKLIPAEGVSAVEVENRKAAWAAAIEDVWSGHFAVEAGGAKQLPIRVQVSFQGPVFHHRVLVRDSIPANDALHWSVRASARSVAHEVGHMLGGYDEYAGGGTDPKDPITDETGSVMAAAHRPDGGRALDRHYRLVLETLERRWGRKDLAIVRVVP